MAAKDTPGNAGTARPPLAPEHQTKLAVGLVSTSRHGLLEVSGHLARDGVGPSRAITVPDDDLSQESSGKGVLAALRALQSDPGTEIIVLIGAQAGTQITHLVLDQVRESDKPTVVCLLGIERRLAWRAGAIPASRLDEAAMRASAWVSGWDQALISTRLEELDDRLRVQARELRPRLGSSQPEVLGLLSSRLFCREAELMLAEVASSQTDAILQHQENLACGSRSETQAAAVLQHTLVQPGAAIVLADVGFGGLARSDLEAAIPADGLKGRILIAHASAEADLPRGDWGRCHLGAQGVILASSSAAAARLAAFCLAAQDLKGLA